MQSVLRKHGRLFAAGIVFAFTAARVLPAQACLGASGDAVTQPACPDCPSPCCPGHCCATVAAVCPASMLSAVAAPAQSLGKAILAPAIFVSYAPYYTLTRATIAPLCPPPFYSPSTTVSVRFCTFQE